ncbi:hypothetical protein CY0110_18872 [Crocosphaera chwakensis CCY0110]|uniref:Uncharacterized protein n=1 Tax=Crocosphaera chwakensis CCY0110 TaxID=391612 RepID=A3IJA6_9CHRO|nr:hypothetical protein CY0110_18872 [Crocosphaera chwakensis CCY0110]
MVLATMVKDSPGSKVWLKVAAL